MGARELTPWMLVLPSHQRVKRQNTENSGFFFIFLFAYCSGLGHPKIWSVPGALPEAHGKRALMDQCEPVHAPAKRLTHVTGVLLPAGWDPQSPALRSPSPALPIVEKSHTQCEWQEPGEHTYQEGMCSKMSHGHT